MSRLVRAEASEGGRIRRVPAAFLGGVLDLGIVLPLWYQPDSAGLDSSVERTRRAGVAVASGQYPTTSMESRDTQGPGPPMRSLRCPGRRASSRAVLDLKIVLPRWREDEILLQHAA